MSLQSICFKDLCKIICVWIVNLTRGFILFIWGVKLPPTKNFDGLGLEKL